MLWYETDNLFYTRLQTNTRLDFSNILLSIHHIHLSAPCTVCVSDSGAAEHGGGWGQSSSGKPDAESLDVSLLLKGANIHWLVRRQVVFVSLLAWGQNSGRQSLFETVTLTFRTDEQWDGFTLFVQFLQQSLTKDEAGKISHLSGNEGKVWLINFGRE